jgi:hypothetical protein
MNALPHAMPWWVLGYARVVVVPVLRASSAAGSSTRLSRSRRPDTSGWHGDTPTPFPIHSPADTLAVPPHDSAPIAGLAGDLSGVYGPFAVVWTGTASDYPKPPSTEWYVKDVWWWSDAVPGTFVRDGYSYLIVSNDYLALDLASPRY